MTRITSKILGLAVALTTFGITAPVSAAKFDVHPVLVTLSERGTGSISLRSRAETTKRFHMTAFEWAQDQDGEMVLTETKDLVFFPAMLALRPNESRQIRVGSKIKPGAVERSYRIFIQELPEARTKAEGSAVTILAKIGLPVFLPAKTPRPAPRVTKPRLQGRKVVFELKNDGNSHVMTEKLILRAKGAKGTLHEEPLRTWYVLAGALRRYEFELPEDVCKGTTRIEVEMTSDNGSGAASLDGVQCK